MTSILVRAMGVGFVAAVGLLPAVRAEEMISYREMCEASAAAALGADYFVVASDERNKLQIYKRGQPRPVDALDLSEFLKTKTDQGSDLEGAASIGTRIYWISSHSRNKDGEVKERRFRFFATDVQPGTPPSLRAVGQKPYAGLLKDLVTAKELKPLKLADAAALKSEERDGLNIEGLAATADGNLLIGFRNPIPDGLALVVPLKNPKGVVKGEKAKFGQPIRLDLQSRGIRSFDRIGSSFLIVAGPPADNGSFAFYRWSGKSGEAPQEVTNIDLHGLSAEASFTIPETGKVQILSDDGDVKTDGVKCKDLEDASKQSFRSIILTP